MELIIQALWAFAVILATWFCYEGSRFDRTPMRLIAFLAIIIGVLHGFHELMRLAETLQGYPLDERAGWEVLLPFGMAVFKYIHVVRLHVRPQNP